MINLLTPESKKRLLKEYRHRLAVMGLITSVFLFAVAFALLIPSYFLTLEKSKIHLEEISQAEQTKEFKETQEFKNTLSNVTQKISKFDALENFVISESIFEPFLVHVNNESHSIQIIQIVYENNEDGRFMRAQGVAKTRDDLLSFIDTLKADARFRYVDVPVSNFVVNTDVDFQMTIEIMESDLVPVEEVTEAGEETTETKNITSDL